MKQEQLGAACVVDGQTGMGADSGPQFLMTIRQTEDSTDGSIQRITEDGAIRLTQQVFITSS